MQNIIAFIKRPCAEKGLIKGTCDLALKSIVLVVWCYLTIVLVRLFVGSLLTDYNPLNKLWWFSYCFWMFFGATWLAYIVFFVRDYNEEE